MAQLAKGTVMDKNEFLELAKNQPLAALAELFDRIEGIGEMVLGLGDIVAAIDPNTEIEVAG